MISGITRNFRENVHLLKRMNVLPKACAHDTLNQLLTNKIIDPSSVQNLDMVPLAEYKQTFEDLQPAFFYPLISGHGISAVKHPEVPA